MILTKLTLCDFGLYAGQHEFVLRPSEDDEGLRPIILFGGKNGAGKTTLLEAIRLCLYGQQALGFRVSAAEYQAYLDKRIHQSRQRMADRALVALEFEHVHQGEASIFRIERSWQRTRRHIREDLALRKDGGVQFGLGPDYWQHLLKELVPIGLADLFFFDGEQIQRLADDEQGGAGLGAALKELLGLNLIEQLEADLRVYLTRQAKADADGVLYDKLEALRHHQQELSEVEGARRQDRAAISARVERMNNKVAEKEAEIASRGGVFAENRSAAEAEKHTLLAQMRQAEQRLDEACSGLLPFALAPTMCRSLLGQLDEEERLEHRLATRVVLQEQATVLTAQLGEDDFWRAIPDDLSSETRAYISTRIQEALLAQAATTGEPERATIIHGHSTQDRVQLRAWIDQALGPVAVQAQSDTRALVDARVQLEQVERVLHAVPPGELLEPLLHELSDLHTTIGQLTAAASAAAEAERRAGHELEMVTREIGRIEAQLHQSARQESKGTLVANILSVLPDFRREQLHLKIADLEAAFTDYFNRLARKSEFVSHVIVNEHDFTMTLVSNEGRYIPKSRLSSGEKQIYAIALLWALRAVAGRPLPVVIDTPLGRLDSSHRQNLVERYFPHASHQVIILSTDTEIDATYFADLEPFVSHAYHLVYDEETGTTREEEGYFWQGRTAVPKEVAHAL